MIGGFRVEMACEWCGHREVPVHMAQCGHLVCEYCGGRDCPVCAEAVRLESIGVRP